LIFHEFASPVTHAAPALAEDRAVVRDSLRFDLRHLHDEGSETGEAHPRVDRRDAVFHASNFSPTRSPGHDTRTLEVKAPSDLLAGS